MQAHIPVDSSSEQDNPTEPLIGQDDEIKLLETKTLWSMLSSLALHSATIAAVLVAAIMLREPEPRGFADFETIEYSDELPQRGGRTADETKLAGEKLVEKETELKSERHETKTTNRDISKSLEVLEKNVIEESEQEIQESGDSLAALTRRKQLQGAQSAAAELAASEDLRRQVAALEKNAAARISNSQVVLKVPGTNSDGSTLFSRMGSRRVLIIVDLSGSMAAWLPTDTGGQIQAVEYVKLELQALINKQFNTATRFNLVTFSTIATPWKPGLVSATDARKKEAIRYVLNWGAVGGTNLFDALSAGLRDSEVQEIYLLSDGEPTVGVTSTFEILKRLKKLNKREVIINTIAFVVDNNTRELLRLVAKHNNGQFRSFP